MTAKVPAPIKARLINAATWAAMTTAAVSEPSAAESRAVAGH